MSSRHKDSSHLSLRARKRAPNGAEFAVDLAARGWLAIAWLAMIVATFVLTR